MSNPETPKYIATNERKEQARRLVKEFLKQNDISILKLAKLLNEKYGRSASAPNIMNKLARLSFKVTELMDIAELFDCELKFVPKTSIEQNNKVDS